MTRDEIQALPTGPKLDRLISERVMGMHLKQDELHIIQTEHGNHMAAWSTSGDALLVVEKLQKRGYKISLTVSPDGATCAVNRWAANHWHLGGHASDQTIPHAICLAALLAVENGK